MAEKKQIKKSKNRLPIEKAGADDFQVALDKSPQKLNREGLQIKDKRYELRRFDVCGS